MTHDYKKALEWVDMRKMHDNSLKFIPILDAMRHALLIADKLMQEPSDAMWEAGYSAGDGDRAAKQIFKAMRDQLLRELDEPVDAQERGYKKHEQQLENFICSKKVDIIAKNPKPPVVVSDNCKDAQERGSWIKGIR